MHLTIIGAGAIGGTIGAHLIRAGHDVLLCDEHAFESLERPEFYSVLHWRISGQNSDSEVLADVLNPTALTDGPEPERDRFIEAFGGNLCCVLDPFGIANGDAARPN